jgi:methanol metabolism-related c-type cytochrome
MLARFLFQKRAPTCGGPFPRWIMGARSIAPETPNGISVVTDFASSSKKNTLNGKGRLAVSLFTFCLAFASYGACADPIPKPAPANPDGKYVDANGEPTFNVGPDGKVDWYTYSGFQRYSAECLRCHGPDAMGSSYAPALKDSIKRLSYTDFLSTVAGGRKDFANGQDKVMPELGLDKNVMCFIDDIYVYLKARSDDAVGRGRPPAHDAKPKAWQEAEDSCMGKPS